MTMPADTPETSPAASTVAVPTELLLHVPPGVGFDRVVVLPIQILIGAEGKIDAGLALTVTTVVVKQAPTEYDIVAVPADIPVTIPPATVAIVGFPLLHVPPLVVFVNVVMSPIHTTPVPDIVEGIGSTVTGKTAVQVPL